jgi:membrane-bound serine protease (ClpP class)
MKLPFPERKPMEILYNADIAYLLLVAGFVLALLAIVTPGTGLLEIGAFFLLALAGVAVLRIGFNLWALILLVLAVIPFVYAIRKPKREWALAVSILAVIAGSLYLFPSNGFIPTVNPILAILVSLAVAGFLWWSIRKVAATYRSQPLQDLEKVIGQVGEAKTRIHADGSAQVGGELWSARSEKPIPAGSRVRVMLREGFILVVEQDDQQKK